MVVELTVFWGITNFLRNLLNKLIIDIEWLLVIIDSNLNIIKIIANEHREDSFNSGDLIKDRDVIIL
jgi:hypothetical protein